MTLRNRVSNRRPAFSMVELLVVIGVIAILVTIAVYSYNRLSPAERVTKASLANCRGLFAEFEAVSGIGSTPSQVFYNGATILKTSTQFGDFWLDPVTPLGPNNESPITLPPSTAATPVAFKISNGQNRNTDVFRNTVLAMSILKTIPANRDAMSKFATNSVLKLDADDSATPFDDRAVPLVADAWGNPIMFVPGNGLRNVNIGMNPDGTYPAGSVNQVIRAPDNRPFFASAGPDGDLSAGDDNVYSFNQ